MKKKIFGLFALLIMICSLTGCIKYNATMEIRKDKSMNFSIIYAMNNSILEMSDDKENAILSKEDKQSLINQGFTVTDYKDDKNTGFTISKKYPNIDNISSTTDIEFNLTKMFDETVDSKLFKVVKGEKKNTYYANFKFNSSDASEEQETETTNDNLSKATDALTSSFDLKFIVNLPNEPISSNATEKSDDGKELTWNLTTEGAEYIKFQFELDNTNSEATNTTDTITTDDTNNVNEFSAKFFNKANMPVIIGGGIFFLISVIVVIVLYIKANKENKKKANKNVESRIEINTPVEVSKEETIVNPVEDTSNTIEPEVKIVESSPVVQPVENESQASVGPTQSVEQTTPVIESQTVAETHESEPIIQLNPEEQKNEENDDNLTTI